MVDRAFVGVYRVLRVYRVSRAQGHLGVRDERGEQDGSSGCRRQKMVCS